MDIGSHGRCYGGNKTPCFVLVFLILLAVFSGHLERNNVCNLGISQVLMESIQMLLSLKVGR